MRRVITRILISLVSILAMLALLLPGLASAASASGAVGIEGTVPGSPPTQGATITYPKNDQTFTASPVTTQGICPKDLLIKLFDNNVFVGADQCSNGSFSIVTTLFSGRNDLVARVYDDLDQAGPDSNTVSVTYNNITGFTGTQLTLTSNYAKRGANPGEDLTWPLIISGGSSPYAVSVDWGDGKTPDLISQTIPGTFTVKHVYDKSGVYKILVKASDTNGQTAFLQLVGVANGPLSQTGTGAKGPTIITRTIVLWWPAAILLVFIVIAFWLGRRHQLYVLRRRLENEEQ